MPGFGSCSRAHFGQQLSHAAPPLTFLEVLLLITDITGKMNRTE